jgi:sporulation integral membrane protein YtvI
LISFYKKYYKTVFDIALMVLTIYLFMLAFSYVYRVATPIFFALVIFLMIEPLAKFLNKRGIKKSIAAAISTLVFILVIIGAMIGLGAIFTVQIQQLMMKLPEYASVLQRHIMDNALYWQDKLTAVDVDLLEKAGEYTATITQKASAIATGLLSSIFMALTTFSTFLVNVVIGIILAYFLSLEIDSWKKLAREKTPNTFKTAFQFLRENVLKGIVTYLKAQAKLIFLTFLIIFVALIVLDVKNAFSIALLSAIFDVLPLLGVSTVFIPWIIYLFVVGQTTLAIWLIVLLAVVLGTRQILEPKITGDSLGVSAFTMLSFMIISLSLFGVAGLILSPILIILIKALYEQGYLSKWIRKPQDYETPI